MPSIFIWKSSLPNTSKNMARIYSGSNWILEDINNSSKSYKYIEQIVISGFGDSVITFNSIQMPTDWIGNDLLEITTVPYKCIKEDTYGKLEHIGNWMRFISNKNITEFNSNVLELEVECIKKWMSSPIEVSNLDITPKKVYDDFQQFLNKYNINSLPIIQPLINYDTNNHYNKHKRNIPSSQRLTENKRRI
jgi:hypothetical protein